MKNVRVWYSICHFILKITHVRQFFIKLDNHMFNAGLELLRKALRKSIQYSIS